MSIYSFYSRYFSRKRFASRRFASRRFASRRFAAYRKQEFRGTDEYSDEFNERFYKENAEADELLDIALSRIPELKTKNSPDADFIIEKLKSIDLLRRSRTVELYTYAGFINSLVNDFIYHGSCISGRDVNHCLRRLNEMIEYEITHNEVW